MATKNAGKIKEIELLLGDLPVVLRSLSDFPHVVEPAETGLTFAENARLKARYYAWQTNLRALADDSGLEVEALGDAPGVMSARYAGADAGDEEKIDKLLTELRETGSDNRQARFICAMAISDSRAEIEFETEGVCGGTIAFEPSGKNGFGYDPIFIPGGFYDTFGVLSADIKRKISHRARAAFTIIEYLRALTNR